MSALNMEGPDFAPNMIATTIATALFCLASTGAMALTTSETVNFSDIGNGYQADALSLNGFDSSLGTLTGLSASLSGTATLAAGSVTGTAEYVSGEYQFGGIIASSVLIEGGGISLFDSAAQGFACFSANESCTTSYDAANPNTSATSGGTASAFIDNAVGLNITVTPLDTAFIGTITSGPTTDWLFSGEITVTYSYTAAVAAEPAPVPLPASMPMLLVGLAALGGMALRRKSPA